MIGPGGLNDRAPGTPRVNIFLRTAGEPVPTRAKCRAALAAFAPGLAANGLAAAIVDDAVYEPCDVAIMFGAPTADPHSATRLFRNRLVEAHDGDLVMVEMPVVGRRVQQRPLWQRLVRRSLRRKGKRIVNEHDDFRVGVNGVFFDTADFNNHLAPGDRWTLLQRRLRIDVSPYRQSGRHVLVLGQVPGDASLHGTDILGWMHDTATELRRLTDRPIVLRPHPASGKRDLEAFAAAFHGDRQISLDHPPKGTLATALRDCWAAVAFSSSGTVDALLRGIPAIALDRGNIAWPVTDHDLAAIERPTLYDRERWLHELAYTQWSLDEIRDGVVWRHLRPALGLGRGRRERDLGYPNPGQIALAAS